MWKTDDRDTPEIATLKRVLTYRPKHSDASLSREWRKNMANKMKWHFCRVAVLQKYFVC